MARRDDDRRPGFVDVAAQLLCQARIPEMGGYVQHGRTSTLEHVARVAAMSWAIADVLSLDVDRASLVRGAVLHDYFLYDWHDPSQTCDRWHGFTHPGHALENARSDFPDLTPTEEDVISHHMFPLVPVPPHTTEGWVVCVADKVSATREIWQEMFGHRH